MLQTLRLKKNADRRIRYGHLWTYSNEVDTDLTPLDGFEPGEQAVLEASSGRPLGTVYVNPAALICGRLISRSPEIILNRELAGQRITQALKLRERFFDRPFYRLVYGESDGLPGLVIDRFNDIFVLQISTAGMELVKDDITGAVLDIFSPAGVFIKNDGKMRAVEGLGEYSETAFGEIPDSIPVIENDVYFNMPVKSGQKTGWYYDHRMNRLRLNGLAEGKSVLDVFSYIGAWGIQAASCGASSVTCVDSSSAALEALHSSADINDAGNKVRTVCGDAFIVLKDLRSNNEKYDIVVLDPPAFITRKKDIKTGEEAYRRINQLAMGVLSNGGILVSCSCSLHLGRERLVELIQAAGNKINKNLHIFGHGHQGPDHPVHPAIPETEYLKAVFIYITE